MSLVTPHQLDLWSSQMGELYNALEGEILRSIIERLDDGKVEDVQKWQMQKLQQLHLFNSDVVKLVSAVTPHAEEDIKRIFEETIEGTIEMVDERIPYTVEPVTPTHIDNVMRGYFNQTWGDIGNKVNQTLISTNYGQGTASQSYVNVLNRTSALFNTGIYNFEEAIEKSVIELAQKASIQHSLTKAVTHGQWKDMFRLL